MPDSDGLYVLASTPGNRSWRLKYRLGKKEKLLTFGSYPDVSLIRARELREAAKATLRDGRDPAVEKKQPAAARTFAAANIFEACAREWYALNKPRWSPAHVPAFWKVCAHACLASVSVPSHAPFPPARRSSRSADPAFRLYAAPHIRSGKGRLCSRLRR